MVIRFVETEIYPVFVYNFVGRPFFSSLSHLRLEFKISVTTTTRTGMLVVATVFTLLTFFCDCLVCKTVHGA